MSSREKPLVAAHVSRRRWLSLPVALAVLIVAWAIVVMSTPGMHFTLLDPKTKSGFEVFLAVVNIFVALVLLLFPQEAIRDQLRWTALGLLILAAGNLGFGYLYPILVGPPEIDRGMYASLIVRVFAAMSLVAGMIPATPRRLTDWAIALLLCAAAGMSAMVAGAADALPDLITVDTMAEASDIQIGPLRGLTTAHWILSLLPLFLAAAAAFVAIDRHRRSGLGRWLAIGMVLFAGAQLHTMLWPSAYSAVFTTASVLRLIFAIVIAAGVILELRNIATERTELLAAERDYARRLEDLALLRANFTAMVAHELASPLCAIRRSAEVLDTAELPDAQRRLLTTIQSESNHMTSLVEDVQTSAVSEREDFAIAARPVPVREIVDVAASYAGSLEHAHVIEVRSDASGSVLADPERIGQVLRNLLSNATKYSRTGGTILLTAEPIPGGLVRFTVTDEGQGIHPEDLTRIFEKFGRGRLAAGAAAGIVPGVGLGLYLSRRIVRASGSELRVHSEPGRQTSFWFDLRAA